MYVERGAQMVFVIQSLLLLISGVYYSVDILPGWMRFLRSSARRPTCSTRARG